jgi:hypothetical protein
MGMPTLDSAPVYQDRGEGAPAYEQWKRQLQTWCETNKCQDVCFCLSGEHGEAPTEVQLRAFRVLVAVFPNGTRERNILDRATTPRDAWIEIERMVYFICWDNAVMYDPPEEMLEQGLNQRPDESFADFLARQKQAITKSQAAGKKWSADEKLRWLFTGAQVAMLAGLPLAMRRYPLFLVRTRRTFRPGSAVSLSTAMPILNRYLIVDLRKLHSPGNQARLRIIFPRKPLMISHMHLPLLQRSRRRRGPLRRLRAQQCLHHSPSARANLLPLLRAF